MFFKRLSKSKSAQTPAETADVGTKDAGANPDTAIPVPAMQSASGTKALAAGDLRRTVDSKSLGFKTTADLKPETGLIGQDRALKALDFGLTIKARDFNIFVLGPPACGKNTAVRAHLAKAAAASSTPSDWVYVNNFSDRRRPRAIELAAGRGTALRQGMQAALRELAACLPAAFETEDYQARRRAIEEEFRGTREDALEGVFVKADKQNIAVLRTPLGFGMAPMHDGKVVKSEVFNQLPETMRRDVESRISALQSELENILADAPKADKRRRKQLKDLNDDVSRHAVEDALEEVSAKFSDVPEVAAFLADVEKDLIENAASFVLLQSHKEPPVPGPIEQDSRFRRYAVNVVVSQKDPKSGAPVVENPNPTVANLTGHMERIQDGQGIVSDFLLIRPGALHRANGGALMIDAREIVNSPPTWNALKRALKSGEINIDPYAAEQAGMLAGETLEPDPIPLNIKVILFGEPDLFYRLQQDDPGFSQLFKVQADFDETIDRSKDNDAAYARLIASIVETHGLRPIDASGVARLIEEASRIAEDSDKLSIEVGRIADIVREADYWSDSENRKVTTSEDIIRAIEERTRRSDRVREDVQESVERGIVLVETKGTKAGQINGLSLVQKGGFSFGRPARITARAHLGQGRVTDIEREVNLGGPLHSKGVMILWGYLAGRFAQDVPLSLAATLVFEQSYGAVEGDSASSAELFALLSALSDTPLRQDLAVTGSINQLGELQAVGGVNEKIEGFYDVCAARGVTGTQGVIIPRANQQHLMLREDVVRAVKDGRFAIYAIKTVDEGLSLLTGLDAGEKGADGRFPGESVNGRIEARLRAFAERARAFALGKEAPSAQAPGSPA
jgi:lon-related putative ATP-dependent protease